MKKIAFISDYFVNDGIGGAELTTDAIMNYGAQRGFEIGAVHCNKINVDVMKVSKDKFHFIYINALIFMCFQ